MTLQMRTIKPVVIILAVAMVLLAVFNYFWQRSVIQTEMEERLRGAINASNNAVEAHLKLYQQMAGLVANTPSAAALFSKGDRSALFQEYSGSYQFLQKHYGIKQFAFHHPPALFFLRLQQPEMYGEDLSAIRKTLVFANTKRTGVSGIEVGRTGLGLRGVEPIFLKGQHIGSVEFGGDIAPALNEAKKTFNVEVAVLLSEETAKVVETGWNRDDKTIGKYLTYFSTHAYLPTSVLKADMVTAAAAAQEQFYSAQGAHGGKDYYIALAPLKDYAGKNIGLLTVFLDATDILAKMRIALLVNVVLYVAILLVVAYAISTSIRKTVIRPVLQLTSAANSISKGELGQKIELASNDELATLAKSIDRMRVSLKKLLG
jgi:methyl-accepting chemotaxis protein